jgi:DNA-directed RNA polymerase II subunit RPB1
MSSDSNDENLVLRLRFKDLVDEWISPEERENRDDLDPSESAMNFLREIEDSLLNDLSLKGIPEITKVYAKKYNEHEFDPETGNSVISNDSWMLETDGVAL